jgi:hypothetical protein
MQKQVDKLLYQTSYQVNFEPKESISKNTIFPPTKVERTKPMETHFGTTVSSFDKRQACTKILYQAKTTGINSRELLDSQFQDGTTYRFEYRNMNGYVPSVPPKLPEPVTAQERKALKYRKWVVG